jgi:hypothetical protein
MKKDNAVPGTPIPDGPKYYGNCLKATALHCMPNMGKLPLSEIITKSEYPM